MEEDKKKLKQMLRRAKYIIYTKVNHVSNSGMFRLISCYIIDKNQPVNIDYWIDKVTNYKRDKQREGLRVSGCGMDMCFAVVYDLSSVLYKDDFYCRGEDCPANDHVNDRPPYRWERDKSKGKLHSDGGYCLVEKKL